MLIKSTVGYFKIMILMLQPITLVFDFSFVLPSLHTVCLRVIPLVSLVFVESLHSNWQC